jgi:cytidyltransferase-like protein
MTEEKVIRVYADGVFDSFHLGHSNMLKQCREAFPGQKVWLIAGVCDQKDIEEHKGTYDLIKDQLLTLNRNELK